MDKFARIRQIITEYYERDGRMPMATIGKILDVVDEPVPVVGETWQMKSICDFSVQVVTINDMVAYRIIEEPDCFLSDTVEGFTQRYQRMK